MTTLRSSRPQSRKKSTGSRASNANPGARAPDNRRQALLDAAALCFGRNGYYGTSTRDIASAVGMLAGSMYYHFKSKGELLAAVHAEGVRHTAEAVEKALAGAPVAPWERLEAACAAHLEAVLEGSVYSQVVTPQFTRGLPATLRRKLVAQRDDYERGFAALIDAVPLPRNVNRRYLRLSLLGSLNWALTWYRPGGDSPDLIARQFVQLYRRQLDPDAD